MFILLYVVFTSLRETRREEFAIYLITGVMFYHLFIRGTMGGVNILPNNYPILTSFNIKKEFFPVVATSTVALLMIVEVGVLFGLMPFFEFTPSWTIVFLPLVALLFLILILGLSYLLSIIYVYAKDIQPIWGVISYSLIFASPIFWYVDEVDGILLEIHKINPLGQIIELAHKVVLGQIPSMNDWAYTSLFVMAILFFGYYIFQKFEKKIVETL